MFSIGEFARLGDISIRMLRHYDEIGLLPPAQVDPLTGYRAYSIAQLRELNRIIALRGLGFSLPEVGMLIGGVTADELRDMLVLRRQQLEQQVEVGRASLNRVEARLRAIEREDELADDIILKTVPAQRLVALERSIPGFGPDNIGPVITEAWDELSALVTKLGLDPDRPYLSCYEETGTDEDKRLTMFFGTPVDDDFSDLPSPAVLVLLPGAQVASCVRQGTPHQVWPRIVHDAMQWIAEHGYEHVRPGRDFYLDTSDPDPAKFVFELHAPLCPRGGVRPAVAPKRLATTRSSSDPAGREPTP